MRVDFVARSCVGNQPEIKPQSVHELAIIMAQSAFHRPLPVGGRTRPTVTSLIKGTVVCCSAH